MKKLLIIVLLLMLTLTFSLPVVASDVSTAIQSCIITVSNNSTATTNVATVFTGNTTAWVANGLMNSSGNNTALRTSSGADVAYMPGYGPSGNPWALFVPSIATNTYSTDILYTGGTANMDGKIRYFPGTTGMTISDDASMEPSDNFTFEVSGQFDTSTAGKWIIEKPAAFELRTDPTENITAAILTSANISPTGFIDPDTEWANETNAYDNNTSTFTREAAVGAGAWSSYLIMTVATSNITGIQYIASTNGGNFDAIDIDLFYNGAWQDVYNGAFVHQTWESRYISTVEESNRARFRMHNNSGGPLNADFYEFLFWVVSDDVSVTTTVSNAEHVIEVDLIDNRLPNGSFERGDPPDNWSVFRAIRNRTATQRVLGTYSANVTASDPAGGNFSIFFHDYPNYLSLAGATVTLGAWVRADSGNTYSQRIALNDGTAFVWGNVIPKDDAWHWETVTQTVNAVPTRLRSIFAAKQETNADVDDLIYVDGAVLIVQSTIADYGNFVLTVDGVETAVWTDNTTYVSVPNNANDWVITENATMLNMLHFKEWVGGNQVNHLEWEYGTTFTDLSGNSNDGTPSFRGASSDPDVSATLASCSPISEADAPAYTLSAAPDFFTVTPAATSNFTVFVGPTYPGRDVIVQISAAGAVPETLPTVIFFTWLLIVISLALGYMMKSAGTNSLFFKGCIIIAVMSVYAVMQIYDVWQIYFFSLMALAIMWLSRQREAY